MPAPLKGVGMSDSKKNRLLFFNNS
jgi:hypothetical protein